MTDERHTHEVRPVETDGGNGGNGGHDNQSLRHPVTAAEHEVEHLRAVADEGESGATPAILTGRVMAIVLPIVVIIIGLSLLAAHIVTRDDGSSEPAAVPWALPNVISSTRARPSGRRSRPRTSPSSA